MLYNNGYVVKDLIENEDLLINHSAYRGVQSYHNWPLAREQDPVSKELTREIDHDFEKNGYGEILGDTELLKKYVAHCKDLKIEVVVMKIMSASDACTADEDLEEREELGYDCMAGDSVSYLVEVVTYLYGHHQQKGCNATSKAYEFGKPIRFIVIYWDY